jgi:hypothetical protein
MCDIRPVSELIVIQISGCDTHEYSVEYLLAAVTIIFAFCLAVFQFIEAFAGGMNTQQFELAEMFH